MKILIPNASSSTNIGDQAILLGLLKVIKKSFPKAKILIHATEPALHTELSSRHAIKETLYSWVAFENSNFLVRIFRLFQALFAFVLYRNGFTTVPVQRSLRKIYDDYRLSEIIIFTGGGYLRTKKGVTQSLNLLMHLFMIRIAKLWGSKVIVAPMSFGPYAYVWQEKLSAQILEKYTDHFLLRESISLEKFTKYNSKKAQLSSDLAFLLEPTITAKVKNNSVIIGFTVRNWLDNKNQKRFENELTTSLLNSATRLHAVIQPIVQVDSPKFGDIDFAIAERIRKELIKAHIPVLKTQKSKTVEEAMGYYARVDVLVGMRMHSNILAALVGTPFIPIAYEYKTKGIAAQMGLLDVSIDSEKDSGREVSKALHKVIDKHETHTDIIKKEIEKIRTGLYEQFQNILAAPAGTSKLLTVSFGIAAYKTGTGIVPLIRALLAQKQSAYILDKIYVHIDGDEDETFALVTEFSQKNPNVVVMQTLPRKGFANAFITLMQKPQSNVTILFNDDIKIEDEHLVEKLIKPFYEYENVGLVCGHPEPLPPVSFVDRAITTSHFAWDTMRMHMQQGHNAFTVDGKIMAMSKSFIEKVDIPKDLADMGNVDAYIYLECKRLGYTYKYVRDARVAYRNPTTVAEHFKWGIRNNANQHRYKKKFGSLVKEKYEKPKLLYISSLGGQFVRNPLGALFIFLSGFYIRGKSKSYAKNFNQMWSVLETSKRLNNEK